MKLTVWHASSEGQSFLSRAHPRAPWEITLPDGTQLKHTGSLATAVERIERATQKVSPPAGELKRDVRQLSEVAQ